MKKKENNYVMWFNFLYRNINSTSISSTMHVCIFVSMYVCMYVCMYTLMCEDPSRYWFD